MNLVGAAYVLMYILWGTGTGPRIEPTYVPFSSLSACRSAAQLLVTEVADTDETFERQHANDSSYVRRTVTWQCIRNGH